MKRNKAILSIILIAVILLVAGASIYISSRLSQNVAVAPTAPTSRPMAADFVAECGACNATALCNTGYTCDAVDGLCKKADGTTTCWSSGPAACTVSATSLCVASNTITCSPDCPTTCGSAAGTISTCTDSCGVAKTKACAATLACANDITIDKKAFKNEAGNSSARYTLTSEIDTVSKNQTFVYALIVRNNSTLPSSTMSITDTLDGENQNRLTFVDSKTGCNYEVGSKTVKCSGINLAPDTEAVYAFRVKVTEEAINGEVIKNLAVLTVPEASAAADVKINAINEVTVSTVVGCNHTCTADAECSSGLVCDTGAGKCRKEACLAEDNCACPVITAAPTERPIRIITAAPTRIVTEAPVKLVEVVEPTVLPETGILDFPGVAAFGGGLLLAVVGILLAL